MYNLCLPFLRVCEEPDMETHPSSFEMKTGRLVKSLMWAQLQKTV